MDIFTFILWIVTGSIFFLSILKDKNRTINSMKISKGMMKNIISQIVGILFLIGLSLTFIPPETIKNVLGSSNVIFSTIIAAFVGSLTLIPAFIAFPLVGSFVDLGASIIPAVAFLTTLTMVGVVTFPLEKQEFGLKFALLRNGLSFLFATIIAIAMGVVI